MRAAEARRLVRERESSTALHRAKAMEAKLHEAVLGNASASAGSHVAQRPGSPAPAANAPQSKSVLDVVKDFFPPKLNGLSAALAEVESKPQTIKQPWEILNDTAVSAEIKSVWSTLNGIANGMKDRQAQPTTIEPFLSPAGQQAIVAGTNPAANLLSAASRNPSGSENAFDTFQNWLEKQTSPVTDSLGGLFNDAGQGILDAFPGSNPGEDPYAGLNWVGNALKTPLQIPGQLLSLGGGTGTGALAMLGALGPFMGRDGKKALEALKKLDIAGKDPLKLYDALGHILADPSQTPAEFENLLSALTAKDKDGKYAGVNALLEGLTPFLTPDGQKVVGTLKALGLGEKDPLNLVETLKGLAHGDVSFNKLLDGLGSADGAATLLNAIGGFLPKDGKIATDAAQKLLKGDLYGAISALGGYLPPEGQKAFKVAMPLLNGDLAGGLNALMSQYLPPELQATWKIFQQMGGLEGIFGITLPKYKGIFDSSTPDPAAAAEVSKAAAESGGGPWAARVSDLRKCPAAAGPILPPAATCVLVGNMPAARIRDEGKCVGDNDVIITGEPTVKINNRLAARIGDYTVHNGRIITGFPTVQIGKPATRPAWLDKYLQQQQTQDPSKGDDPSKTGGSGGVKPDPAGCLGDAKQQGAPMVDPGSAAAGLPSAAEPPPGAVPLPEKTPAPSTPPAEAAPPETPEISSAPPVEDLPPEEPPWWDLLAIRESPLLHYDRNDYNYCPPTKPPLGVPQAGGVIWQPDGGGLHGPDAVRGQIPGRISGFQCNYNPDGTLDLYSESMGTFDVVSPTKVDLPIVGTVYNPVTLGGHFLADVYPHIIYNWMPNKIIDATNAVTHWYDPELPDLPHVNYKPNPKRRESK